MRKKILYVTHTPWGWIKQRPQFLAEYLSDQFDVDVYFRMSNRGKERLNDIKSSNKHILIRGFKNLPFERIPVIPIKWLYQINKFLWMIKKVKVDEYDYLWITDPALWWQIPLLNYKGKVIYDCMDDLLSFPYYKRYPRIVPFLEEQEFKLVKDADFVICTAESLKQKLLKRYNIKRDYKIVNNAISDSVFEYMDSKEVKLPAKSLVYIGTVSEWIDFDLILKSLDKYEDLSVYFYGPIRMTNTPKHERLFYCGSIDHSKIIEVMNAAAGLVMPFVVNELILSVNPVKLYEYIYSGKPIASIRYPETEKFSKYITLYNSPKEFFNFIESEILLSVNKDKNEMQEFALKNTWSFRCKEILSFLKESYDEQIL